MRKVKISSELVIILLAIVFSLGLTFASLELPESIDRAVQENINFPGYDQESNDFHISKTELYIRHYHLKTIGYCCLAIIIVLIIIGFTLNKKGLSTIGAFLLFLPVFGQFALTMFFLAGLGFLRLLWMPFVEISPYIMKLGDIAYLPRDIVLRIGGLVDLKLDYFFSVLCILCGLLLFVFGVIAWFHKRFRNKNVASFWIYKLSRHPQYLGWILWSYGIFVMPFENQKSTWEYPDSLPWLLSTLIIIGVSMLEELSMRKKYGDEYQEFYKRTPFLFPIPKILNRFLKLPLRLFHKENHIKKRKQIYSSLSFYLITLLFLSYCSLQIKSPSPKNRLFNSYNKSKVEKYVTKLKSAEKRRTKDLAAMDLERFGEFTVDPLIELVTDSDYYVRNYAIRTLGVVGDQRAVAPILSLLKEHPNNVSTYVVQTLGMLQAKEAEEILIHALGNTKLDKGAIATSLWRINSKQAIPHLIDALGVDNKWSEISIIHALGKLKAVEAIEPISIYLTSSEVEIKQAAIIALTNIGLKSSISRIKPLLNYDNWEIRIYATEAIKQL